MSRLLALAFAATLVAGCAPREHDVRWVDQVRWAQGDSAAWSGPAYADPHWAGLPFRRLPRPAGVLWVRVRVPVAERSGGAPLGVFVAALASHELWWDGVPIGRGGRVGRSAAEEIPGPVESLHHVPDSLAGAGEHIIALRTSAFHQRFSPPNSYWRLAVGSYDDLALLRRRGAWSTLISLSGILFGALLAFATFALDRRDRSALLLGGVAVAAALLLGAEAWRPLWGYTYDRHIVRLLAITSFTWAVCVLLAAFVLTRFPRPRARRALLPAIALISAAPFVTRSWDVKLVYMHAVALLFACGWTALAARGRRRGALPALFGTLVALTALFLDQPGYLDRWFYYAMDVLLACLVLSHLLVWRDEISATDRARARSASLEAELLKRHLQPHFLMNTLTAIGGWIQEDPPTAVRMIGALGDELRTLTRISDRRLVPMAEELRLCRAHLETMSLRRDVAYRLEADGVDDAAQVPPALIHTLIENAVTHGPAGPGEMVLRLDARRAGGRMRYTLTSALDPSAPRAFEPGTGTRYVVARLREAWGDDWTLEQGEAGGCWRVQLTVPDGAA